MDEHVSDFYCQASDEAPHGNFHAVISLHNDVFKVDWETLNELDSHLNKGWYELAQLSSQDRVEFSREYWMTQLPYAPHVHQAISRFFDSLDDIGIFVVQKKYGDPFFSEMVYSVANKGFYHGKTGASDEDIALLQQVFPDHIIPEDYLAFLKIHNGFSKSVDTGILSTHNIEPSYRIFQELLDSKEPLKYANGKIIDPKNLIPFYESFGMPIFQCFWTDWYPQQEMGNVYYSGYTHTISDITQSDAETESLAFPTFAEWLAFYLESV
ncbi:MAG: hypothetical protein Tsb0021_15370 [Chlamydiales bacterium]